MKRDKSVYDKRRGFTLIEMLIVIVIILILSGMVLKIMTLVSRKTGITGCMHDLLQIENALAEYYSEYGQYPPGVGDAQENVEYEYENSGRQPEWFREVFLTDNRYTNIVNLTTTYFPDMQVYKEDPIPPYLKGIPESHQNEQNSKFSFGTPKWGLGYRYGLVSHLWPREYTGDKGKQGLPDGTKIKKQQSPYRKDTDRDEIAKKKWAHFLVDLKMEGREDRWYREDLSPKPDNGRHFRSSAFESHTASTDGSGTPKYWNQVDTIKDPWGKGYYYECKPPFYSYKIWSSGPDGRSYYDKNKDIDYRKDDIHAGSN